MDIIYQLSTGMEARLANAKPANKFMINRSLSLVNTPLGRLYEHSLRTEKQLMHKYKIENGNGKKVGSISTIDIVKKA